MLWLISYVFMFKRYILILRICDLLRFFNRSMDDCIHLVCCGLYDLLCGVVLTMPDVMVVDVLNEIIQPDVLIVLINHPSPLIQQGVLKVSVIALICAF